MSSLSSTTTAHNLDSSDANGSCSSTKSGTLNKQQCCDAFITWRLGSLFFFFFLLLLLRCIVTMDQTLTIEYTRCRVLEGLRPQWRARGAAAQNNIHLTFCAFCADLVILPLPMAFFSTPLITPTATVWRMSRTANLPEGRKKRLFLLEVMGPNCRWSEA